MAMAVHLNRPPHSAFLVVWGRHPTGWWACVTFRARVAGPDESELAVAAWVPGHAVRKAPRVTTEHVPRLQLPESDRDWPAPPRWPFWYAGVWPDGPLPLPLGLGLLTGAAWRSKPPRSAGRPGT